MRSGFLVLSICSASGQAPALPAEVGALKGRVSAAEGVANKLDAASTDARTAATHVAKRIAENAGERNATSAALEQTAQSQNAVQQWRSENSAAIAANAARAQHEQAVLNESSGFIHDNAGAVQSNRQALTASAAALVAVGNILDEHRLDIQQNTRWMQENKVKIEENAAQIREHSVAIEETKVFLKKARDDITKNAGGRDANSALLAEHGRRFGVLDRRAVAARQASQDNEAWMEKNRHTIESNAEYVQENAEYLAKEGQAIARNSDSTVLAAQRLVALDKTAADLAGWVRENGDAVAKNTALMNGTRQDAMKNAAWIAQNSGLIAGNKDLLDGAQTRLEDIHAVLEHNHELVAQLFTRWEALADRAERVLPH